ncbi:MAG: diacylglycerol kinase family lipid kinase [Candidatus Marinimicrobia bacterium]|nr:diacylglycerol kinase family lipid kinase [Candidatus Neomarinimicrobiota bacterium]
MTKSKYKYLLIVNPAGGSGRTMKALPEIEATFRKHGMKYEFHFTQEPMHAVDLVKELADDFDVVVAVGGDGTINEIINGMPEFDKPFGLIPIGTGNDFSRSCCIPYDSVEKAIDIIRTHDIKKLDLGEVNGRRFINVLGMGFEGQANAIGRKLDFIKGTIKYILAIAWALIFYKRMRMKIECDEKNIDDDIYLVSVGNGWNVGGGLQLTPKARMEDHVFDVCLVKDISRWRVLSNFVRLTNGTIDTLEEIEIFQTDHLKITSTKPIPLHLDGEQLDDDRTSLEIKLIPDAQQVIGNWNDPKYLNR